MVVVCRSWWLRRWTLVVEMESDFVVGFGDGFWRWGLGRNFRWASVVDFGVDFGCGFRRGVLVVDFGVGLWWTTLVLDIGGGFWWSILAVWILGVISVVDFGGGGWGRFCSGLW